MEPEEEDCRPVPLTGGRRASTHMISQQARATRRAAHAAGQQRLKLNRDLMLRLASALSSHKPAIKNLTKSSSDASRKSPTATTAATTKNRRRARVLAVTPNKSESGASLTIGVECKQIVALPNHFEVDDANEERAHECKTSSAIATNKQHHGPSSSGRHLCHRSAIFKSTSDVVVVGSVPLHSNQRKRTRTTTTTTTTTTSRRRQMATTSLTRFYCSTKRRARGNLCSSRPPTGCGCEMNRKQFAGELDANHRLTWWRRNNETRPEDRISSSGANDVDMISAKPQRKKRKNCIVGEINHDDRKEEARLLLIKVICERRRLDGNWRSAASLTYALMIVVVFECERERIERALLVALDSATAAAEHCVEHELVDATACERANNDKRPEQRVASGRRAASTVVACSRRMQQTESYLTQHWRQPSRRALLDCSRLSRAFISNGAQVQVHADARARMENAFMAAAAAAADFRRRRAAALEPSTIDAAGLGRCHAIEKKKICNTRNACASSREWQREIKTSARRHHVGRDHFYDHDHEHELTLHSAHSGNGNDNDNRQATKTTQTSTTNTQQELATSAAAASTTNDEANCLANYLLALFSLLLLFLLSLLRLRRRPAATAADGQLPNASWLVLPSPRRPRREAKATRRKSVIDERQLHTNGSQAANGSTQRENERECEIRPPRQPMKSISCSVRRRRRRRRTTSNRRIKFCDINEPHRLPTRARNEDEIFTLKSIAGEEKRKRKRNWPTKRPASSMLNLPLLLLLATAGLLLLPINRAPLIQQSSALQVTSAEASQSATTTTRVNLNNSSETKTTTTTTTGAPEITTTTTSTTTTTLVSSAKTASADELSRAVLATMSTQSSLSVSLDVQKSTRAPQYTRSLPAVAQEDDSLDDELQPEGEQPQQQSGSSSSTARAAASYGPGPNEMAPSYGEDLVDSSMGTGPAAVAAAPDDQAEYVDQSRKSVRSNSSTQIESAVAGKPQATDALQLGGGGVPAGRTKLEGLFDDVTDFSRISAMLAIIFGDICGNSLVILSVVRHSKLRVTTNWFVVSLACADILVALFAMTFNVSVQITGRWVFPALVCDFWNSCDVMASTASILHLCCISIDRYYAIMRPLDYPMKITTRRVCYALAVVWISSALLSFIPIFTGIYTTSDHMRWQLEHPDQCEFVVNRVYALVSSSISFWIPCCIMVFTYYRIYKEATRQEKFIYKAQNMLPAPQVNHHHHHHSGGGSRAKQHRSKSMAITSLSSSSGGGGAKSKSSDQANKIKAFAKQTINELDDTPTTPRPMDDLLPGREQPQNNLANSNSNSIAVAAAAAEQQPLTGSAIDLNNNNNSSANSNNGKPKSKLPAPSVSVSKAKLAQSFQPAAQLAQQAQAQNQDDDDRDSNSGQSTPTKRSISKMKREHKAAKTLGIIMGVFILCWLPFFSWYTPQHICGSACEDMIPRSVVTLLSWIGYFNSTLNPIIYAYFNHEFRDAFKKTLQWIFCCCRDLKCLRVNRPNDNQHYNCTYRSTQEIGLVTNG